MEQRDTFDEVASLYDAVRPSVPASLLTTLLREAGIGEGTRLLEVGCGSGKLTVPLARHGARITAVDPGEALLSACRKGLGPLALPDGQVALVPTTFEAFAPELYAPFEVVVCCQAAHWVAPEVFLARSAQALRSGGSLALLWHLDTSAETPFWKATQSLYDRYMPDADEKPPRTLFDHLRIYTERLEAPGDFDLQVVHREPWTRVFDTETYLAMLRTHSPVRMLSPQSREAFLDGHAKVLEQFGGSIERHHETVLVVAARQL